MVLTLIFVQCYEQPEVLFVLPVPSFSSLYALARLAEILCLANLISFFHAF